MLTDIFAVVSALLGHIMTLKREIYFEIVRFYKKPSSL